MTVTAVRHFRSVVTVNGSDKELERAQDILREYLPDGRVPADTFDFEAEDIDIGVMLIRKVAYVDHIFELRDNSLTFIYVRDARDFDDGA